MTDDQFWTEAAHICKVEFVEMRRIPPGEPFPVFKFHSYECNGQEFTRNGAETVEEAAERIRNQFKETR